MKTLLLLRHAKSSWDDPALRDFDRPLNKRGIEAAPLVGKFMRKRKVRPDLVLSSPAKRATQTVRLVMESGRLECQTRYDQRLYAASASTLRDVVSETEESADEVLLVGHNPGLEGLLQDLTGELKQLPTAALARIVLDVKKWSKLSDRSGELRWLVRPKGLRKG
jgi:phosphohistidine phosphatase